MGKIVKRGIFFTFIAIVIMAVFILVLTPQSDLSLKKDTESIGTKIGNVDAFIASLEDSYFRDVLRSTTFRSITSLDSYINKSSKFLTNFDAAVSEVMINGTINKVPIDSITGKKMMENNTLVNWSNAIIAIARDTYNINATIVILNVSVTQTDQWSITSKLYFNLTVKAGVAEWKRSSISTSVLSLEGMHDPSYAVNSGGLYDKTIKQSTIPFDKWNITQVRTTIRDAKYIYWQNAKAPSYLMRLVNNTNSSQCCGIESLVDPNKLNPNDQRESYVDYLFWSHTYNPAVNCTALYNITNPATSGGIWDEFKYFKLDFDHVILYNITSIDAVRNC